MFLNYSRKKPLKLKLIHSLTNVKVAVMIEIPCH